MKLLTMERDHQLRAGVVVGDDVLDLAHAADVYARSALPFRSVKSLLALGRDGTALVNDLLRLAAASGQDERLREAKALVPASAVLYAPVVPDPDVLLCGSMNSRGHLHEMGDPLPPKPIGFQKVRSSLVGSGRPILLPPDNADMVDWEGEFCVVMGATCHRVSAADAPGYIAGYTLLNDVSAREFVKPYVTAKTVPEVTSAWDHIVAGKNFPTFCPVGPVIATADEFGPKFDYHMETLVNGVVMQTSTTEDLVFSVPDMISYFSHFIRFQPGDIISMGSPPGVGMARKPPLFLKPGDVVDVREPRIGVLTNTVASGA